VIVSVPPLAPIVEIQIVAVTASVIDSVGNVSVAPVEPDSVNSLGPAQVVLVPVSTMAVIGSSTSTDVGDAVKPGDAAVTVGVGTVEVAAMTVVTGCPEPTMVGVDTAEVTATTVAATSVPDGASSKHRA
jgi:hypothetical protein